MVLNLYYLSLHQILDKGESIHHRPLGYWRITHDLNRIFGVRILIIGRDVWTRRGEDFDGLSLTFEGLRRPFGADLGSSRIAARLCCGAGSHLPKSLMSWQSTIARVARSHVHRSSSIKALSVEIPSRESVTLQTYVHWMEIFVLDSLQRRCSSGFKHECPRPWDNSAFPVET